MTADGNARRIVPDVPGPAATITGRVIERATGKMISATKVLVHAGERDFAGKTGEDGAYEITGVPPGDYSVEIDDPAFFVPRQIVGGGWQSQRISPAAGKNTSNLIVEKSPLVMGQILDPHGQPAAGAIVSFRMEPMDRQDFRYVVAGEDGDFLHHMPPQYAEYVSYVYLTASSPTGGYVETKLQSLTWGEQRSVTAQLPGAVRVKGLVTDAVGHPDRGSALPGV